MINGTKLLNVAMITRGQRDYRLKGGERVVVKAGSRDVKGIWYCNVTLFPLTGRIPFYRALELATKYRIAEYLYPLFEPDVSQFT